MPPERQDISLLQPDLQIIANRVLADIAKLDFVESAWLIEFSIIEFTVQFGYHRCETSDGVEVKHIEDELPCVVVMEMLESMYYSLPCPDWRLWYLQDQGSHWPAETWERRWELFFFEEEKRSRAMKQHVSMHQAGRV